MEVEQVEGEDGLAVDQVAKSLEGVLLVHLEQQHSSDLTHALHVAQVGSEEGVGLQDVSELRSPSRV